MFVDNSAVWGFDGFGLAVDIPVAEKLSGKWHIYHMKVSIKDPGQQLYLGTKAPGFEVQYVPEKGVCSGEIKILQTIKKSGIFTGIGPHFDSQSKEHIKKQKKRGNALPQAYTENGAAGTHGEYSYQDGPYDTYRGVPLDTAQDDGMKNSTFTISSCAICCVKGKYRNIGCANFEWLDVDRKVVWAGCTSADSGNHLSKNAESPSNVWEKALGKWNALYEND